MEFPYPTDVPPAVEVPTSVPVDTGPKVRNAQYANADHSMINCEINHPAYGWIPNTAAPGTEYWERLVSEVDCTIAEYVPPTAAAVKNEMWQRIKAERDRRSEYGGFPLVIGGVKKWFHSDTKSRTQQTGLVLMGSSLPTGIMWKTMDGSFVEMTPQIAQAILGASAAQEQATFTAAEVHRAALQASQEPTAYNFTGGWPEIYQG